MRRIWLRRNAFIFKNQFEHPRMIVNISREGLEDFQEAQCVFKEKKKTQVEL